ncbi:MAG: porin [Polyangiales bacterium]
MKQKYLLALFATALSVPWMTNPAVGQDVSITAPSEAQADTDDTSEVGAVEPAEVENGERVETTAAVEVGTDVEAEPSSNPAPSPLTTDVSVVEPVAAPEPAAQTAPTEELDGVEEEDLLPPGEAEMMGAHEVESTAIRFVPGKGLELTSADGRFRLQTRVRAQFRWTLADTGDDWAQRFRIRRARVVFSGNTFHRDVRYKFELAFSPNDVGIRDDFDDDATDRLPTLSPLLDFYIDFRQLRDFQVRVGQSKIFSNRQRVISSGNLQLVDRALLNSEFTLDRDIGVDIRSRDFLGLDMLRYYAGVFIARGRDSQGFDDFGMMYLARLEYLPLGMFNDYSESDFERGGARLSIGAGYGYIDRARGDRGIRGSAPADGGTTDTQHVFVDALFKWQGFSALAEFAWRTGSRNPGEAVDEMGNMIPVAGTRDGIGLNLQAGYLLPNLPVEIAARYGLIRGLGDDTALSDRNELVIGASYYIARHPYKLQMDYTRLWGDSFGEGANQLRVQLQVSL